MSHTKDGLFEITNHTIRFFYYPVDYALTEEQLQKEFRNFKYHATGQGWPNRFPINLDIFTEPRLFPRNKRLCMTITVSFNPQDIESILNKTLTKDEYKTWLHDELLKLDRWSEDSTILL